MNDAQQVAKALNALADLCLEMDAENTSADFRYAPEDAMNVLLVFNHVCGNMMIHRHMSEGRGMEETTTFVTRTAGLLADIFKAMTSVDSRTYYKTKA